ncbi:MAG: 4Fe-4S dicluster domain-containing protein, partial [Magnetococcales bacterium]|nr:4Fe-4S dicluster domain-containing protein [Magnetococcales bacterium]
KCIGCTACIKACPVDHVVNFKISIKIIC